MISSQQIRLDYHARVIEQAECALHQTNCPITHQKLYRIIDDHTAAINALGRKTSAADRAAKQDVFLVRT